MSAISNALNQNARDFWRPGQTVAFNPNDVIDSLFSNFHRVLGAGLFPWAQGMIDHRSDKMTAWYVYMPLPVGIENGPKIPTGLSIGGVPLKLRFGSTKKKHKGRIIGVGLEYNRSSEHQLFRLDAGLINGAHGVNGEGTLSNEVEVWDDPPDVHYHVLKLKKAEEK